MIVKNALNLIGNTPMYQINGTSIYVKLEKFNLGGSIKDRAALGMIEDAEKKGLLNKDSIIIEPSSGNTGIAIAMIGRLKGYKVIIVMPDTMSIERRNIIKAYGAELLLTEGSKGMKGSIDKANELAENDSRYFVPNQFTNSANWIKHYDTTSLEILNDVPDVDIFVVGVGTGGSFTGVSKRLKENNNNVICVAAEPYDSPVISGGKAGPHKIQGIGAGFVTEIFNFEYLDELMQVKYEDAERETLAFSRETGILIGISTGANIWAAKQLAEKYGKNKNIVTISPDGGEKYLSLGIY